MSAADAQAKRSYARQIPILRILKIAWLVLWVSGGSQPTVRPSYPGAARTRRGLYPPFLIILLVPLFLALFLSLFLNTAYPVFLRFPYPLFLRDPYSPFLRELS